MGDWKIEMEENEICKKCGQPATRHVGRGSYVCPCYPCPRDPLERSSKRYDDEDMPFGV